MPLSSVYLASGGAQLEVNKQKQEEADKIRQNLIQRQQVDNQSRNITLDENRFDLEKIDNQLNFRIKQNQLQKDEYENKLLQNMQNAESVPSGQQSQGDNYQALAQQSRALGQQMNKVDPLRAKKYFDMADSYDNTASSRIKTSLEIKAKQVDQAGQILANIGSQEDLNAALPDLASTGLVIPPEMRDWSNPQTRDWITKQALRSPTIAKDLQDQIGFLADKDALAVDSKKNQVLDENQYNKSLRERASQISSDMKATGTSRGSQFVRMRAEQIMGATEELSRSLHIIGTFPVQQTSGFFGDYGGNKSFNGAPLNAIARFATSEDEQQFQTTASNIGQALAIIESGGYKPNQSQIDNYNKKFTFGKGTTIGARMFTIADAIAQADARLKIIQANPDVPQAQKDVITETMSSLHSNFPLSPEEIKLSQKADLSYKAAFQLKKSGNLERYLELKAKEGEK